MDTGDYMFCCANGCCRYLEQCEELVKWCGHVHTQVVLPDVIIVDDFHVFAATGKVSHLKERK
jgi:hypothetical protein